jgi:RNA polymerase sigma-70 factor (ECF subfamily)
MKDEKQLLLRITEGEERAFSILVHEYWNTIFSHAFAYLKSVEKAEEITQDIFMRLWKARAGLGKIKNLDNYLFILARNQIFNETRKRITQLYAVDEKMEALNATPVQQTEFRETYQLLQQGITLLPEKRKKVFIMSRFEGMSNEEIAAALGIHKDTVYQYLVKALSFLKIYLQEHSDDLIILIILLGSIS